MGHLEPAKVNGDRSRLQQLFLNLAENAVKYTPPRGSITFSLNRNNGHAVVEVSDTGIGIPSREQAKVFERFYRVDHDSPSAGGSGLGLSIARWIAEAHNGTIEVRSRVRKGSTFVVTLPLETPQSLS